MNMINHNGVKIQFSIFKIGISPIHVTFKIFLKYVITKKLIRILMSYILNKKDTHILTCRLCI